MSVCKYCERPLNVDFEDIGICSKCLDAGDNDLNAEDDIHYNNMWDFKVEDDY